MCLIFTSKWNLIPHSIDGKTGKRLWTQWAPHEVFAITCQGDLDKDGTNDCVAGGRAGVSYFDF